MSSSFSSPTKVILQAPLSGQLLALERVPDPVFAQKMVGDGISIDPLSQVLLAPCDGEVVQLHTANHAITILTSGGLEVLIHIGLDTVSLKGKGFMPKVKLGDKVQSGAALIEFEADFIATHARSLLTQLVITNSDRVARFEPASGTVEAGKDPVLTLHLADISPESALAEGKVVTSEAIIIPNLTGLHARPAAVLANVAKKYKAEIKLRRGDDYANAKSVTSILALEVSYNDKIVLVAKGEEAEAAIDTLTELVKLGLGDEGHAPAPAPATTVASAPPAPQPKNQPDDPNVLVGVSASPGIAVGTVFQLHRQEVEVEEDGTTPDQEWIQLTQALEKGKAQLQALQAKLHGTADPAKAAIFAAHQELLEDPDLLDLTASMIDKGKSAAFAWKSAVNLHAERLAQLRNQLLAQRANDLRDVGQRVLVCLTGVSPEPLKIPADSILIAEDLTPSDTATLDRKVVRGFCTSLGGATSHVAILARSLDIPSIAGIDPKALTLANGTPVILDGSKGTLRLNPLPEEMERIQHRIQSREAKRKSDLSHAHEPAVTRDGHHIEVVGNIGGLSDAKNVPSLGGEGVGLLRSEFLFMERATAPTEDEQFQAYKEIAEAVGADRPLIIRTLDVGGDKPLAYLPIAREDNPFLGERGIRIGLDRPVILRTQLRAILRASKFGKISVMFPMIAMLSELRDAKAIFLEECQALGVNPIPMGIMVEVPSVAILAEQFAREADFFSIGTNDLTQYTLAMDRGNPKMASKVDALNPSLLHLIDQTVRGAQAHGRWVGVCGGIASDPHAVPILIGLGVTELSVSLPVIPAIKAQIRNLSVTECRALAGQALKLDKGAQVRELVPINEDSGETK